MIFAFVRFCDINSNNVVKIIALSNGLRLCTQMNITHIEVVSNSKLIVWWEKDGQVPWQTLEQK